MRGRRLMLFGLGLLLAVLPAASHAERLPPGADPRLPPSPRPLEVPRLPPPGGQFSLGEELRAEQRLREVERDLLTTEHHMDRGRGDAQTLRDRGILRGERQHLRQRLQR